MSPNNLITVIATFAIAYLVDADPRGASKAAENEFPSVVSLSMKHGKQPLNHFCTGVLISKRHVITAAHCIEGMDKAEVEILAGSHDLKSAKIKKFEVESWITYEDWALKNQITFYKTINDVAIIKLVVIDTNIPYIRILYVRGKKLNGSPVLLTGWGTRNEVDSDPIMQKTSLVVLPKNECIKKVENVHPVLKRYIGHDGLMCTDYDPSQSFSSSCGFSGGPVFQDKKILIAIHMGKCLKGDRREFSIEAYLNYHKFFIRHALQEL